MKKGFFLSSVVFFLFGLGAAFAQEIKFSGEAGSFWGTALRSENAGNFVIGDTYLDGKIDAFYGNSSAFAQGRVGYDQVQNKSFFDLKEIFLDYTADLWGIRVGRQKIIWGKADGIDVTNVLCPRDYSSSRALFEKEYLGIDSARLSLNKDSLGLDAYFIPFGGYGVEKKIGNAEYALKLSGYFSRLDLSFYGFYGFENKPYYGQVPAGTPERMEMFGADAAIPAGETVIRIESAFFPSQDKKLRSLAGFDWMPSGWTFTAQYYCDCLFDEIEKSGGKRSFEHGATLNISKTLFSESLKLSASGLIMLIDFDSVLELSGEYSLSDCIFLKLGAYIFNEGKEKGTYGQYENMTNIYVKARYLF